MAEKHLLVDIGNSAIKYCLESELQNERVSILNHGDGDFFKKLAGLHDATPLTALSLSSVYKADFSQQIKNWCNKHQVRFYQATSQSQSGDLKNGYTVAQRLGIDRWLAMIAVREQTKSPFFVVSCGTAVTFDAVDSSGQHLGGAIMPGLVLMQSSLSEKTIALQVEHDLIASENKLALDTTTAIANGTMMAITGFIEKMADITNMEMKQGILTGGYASPVAIVMGCDIKVSPNLVMKGLAMSSREKSVT
ncbi:MAG: type III pantothenate kinase [Gammaproteobacteria bacterium]|nr:type III pantothenate kinase [Gammaproteobacteria bacterium]